AAAAAVTFGLALMGAGGLGPASLVPEVDGAVARHAAAVSAMATGGLMEADGGADPLVPPVPVVPTTEPTRSPEDLPPPFDAPEALGGYELVRAFRSSAGLHLVYQRGPYGLSVFESVGDVDFGSLPPGGRRLDVAGSDGWRWETAEVAGRVVVVDHHGVAVVLAGDEPGEAVLDAARSLPDPPPLSVAQRLRRAAGVVLEDLSLVG
ncbi:MAG: hypothetical protein ACRDZ9_06300, partial [Acidimicrobiales bacterium]